MPRKKSSSRGSSRGGTRGGSSSRGRGGGRGGSNYGRFYLSKSAKRKGKGKFNPRPANGYEDPEFMDLGAGEYLPSLDSGLEPMSMKALSRRPNRSMMEEARYTERHFGHGVREPLRNKPLIFVKSAEIYDPRKLTVEKLLKREPLELSEDLELLRVDDDDDKENEKLHDADNDQGNEALYEASEVYKAAEEEQNVSSDEAVGPDDDITQGEHSESAKESDGESEAENNSHSLDEGVNSATIDVDMVQEPPDEDKSSTEEESEIQDEGEYDSEVAFMIDEQGDESISAHYGARKANTKELLQEAHLRLAQLSARDDTPNAELADPVATLEHEPYMSVGKVIIRTEIDKNGDLMAEMPKGKANRNGTGFKDLHCDYYEEESDTDEEGAFEDYLAQVMMGGQGLHDDFDTPILFSCSDSEDQVSEMDDGLNDGLNDILDFAQNQQRSFADLDVPPTRSLRAKGRSKKLKLEFEEAVDAELQESLLEQFQYQKKSRRDKKLRKKEKLKLEALENNDLFVKYDYSLHIKDIKDEFESFLHDPERENMSFPPLDPHGNKTVNKLATHYNMKCTRCGNGRHIFMKISKARKTFHYLPDYNLISYVMKQRPIFKRSDVKKRTREEIESSEKSSSRRGPKNNAFVREGDIVGAAAPEISSNNIGRQLLEKLGWVKGEGLGAHGNKGISVPLMATVKKSKTGLK